MRILHVNDQAGVSGCLAKYQRRLGHTVTVICRDGYDGLKQKEYYGVKIVGPKRRRFKDFGLLQKPLRLINRTAAVLAFYGWVAFNAHNYDVIHIHSQYLVSFVLPFKMKVIEFHGDDIRNYPSKRWSIDRFVTGVYLSLFGRRNHFLVSTPDLLKQFPVAVWLPNPVDIELFSDRGVMDNRKAVYFHNWYETGKHALAYAKVQGLSLTVVDRTKHCHLFYGDMPNYLRGFKYMIDRKEIQSLSKTALESLAIGCTVIDWKGQMVKGLPFEHYPSTVAAYSISLYKLFSQLGENKK